MLSIWARVGEWFKGLFKGKSKKKVAPDQPDDTPGVADVQVKGQASDEIMALAHKHKVKWQKMLQEFNKGLQIEKEMGVPLKQQYITVMENLNNDPWFYS